MGVRGKLGCVIYDIFRHAVLLEREKLASFSVKQGVAQGCCLPVLLTLGAHAQEGYSTCLVCVCVCVCVYSSANNACFYAQNEVRRGLS